MCVHPYPHGFRSRPTYALLCMRRSRPTRASHLFSAAALCLFLLAGCENPAGLPDGIDAPDGNDPSIRTLAADSAMIAPLQDLTGAFITAEDFDDFRALAGHVNDPAFGTVTALAYLDVLPPSSYPDGFQDRPVREVTLRLERGYVYGDTLMPTMFDVRQVSEEWDAVGAPSDTLFPAQEAIITSFEVAASDTLVEVPLPASWIAELDTTLRSDQFSTLFHGFQLQAQDGSNAVYGFTGDSTLELISAEDTVIYQASELFTNTEATPAMAPPADGLFRLQDGTGLGLTLNFDLDTLSLAAINTAFLRVNADTLAVEAPMGFVRPLARELALFGFIEGEDPVFITTATLSEENQTYSFGSNLLTGLLQDLVLDRSELDGFAVGFPSEPSGLDVVPLAGLGSEGGPRAVVILIQN